MNSVFDIVVSVARNSRSNELVHDSLTGETVLNQDSINAFSLLYNENKLADLRVDGKSEVGSNLEGFSGKVATFELSSFSGESSGGFFVLSLNDLLRRPEQCLGYPEKLYLLEDDVLFPEESSQLLDRYKLVTELVKALYDLAHFSGTREFSFVYPNRLTIPLRFCEDDLVNAQLKKAKSLRAELTAAEDHHTERRVEIFLTATYDRLKSVDKSDRLGHLLRHLDEIYNSYRTDYKIYARDFTHNQVVAKFDSQNADYFEKLQKTVNEISTKVLSIPFAYILIAGQLTDFGGLRNHTIIIGAFFFALLMSTLVLLQYGVLRQINSEIEHFKSVYNDYISKAPFNDKYRRLTNKVRIQKLVLLTILSIVILLFFMTLKIYADLTTENLFEVIVSKVNGLINFFSTK